VALHRCPSEMFLYDYLKKGIRKDNVGQYHYLVNLDKHEFIDPHKLGDGLKMWEQGASLYGTCAAAAILLASSCKDGPRGGGDFQIHTNDVVGMWAGDRVCWVGDYAEDSDLPEEYNASSIFNRCGPEREWLDFCLNRFTTNVITKEEYDMLIALPMFNDISELLIPVLEAEFEVKIERQDGLGFANRTSEVGGKRLTAIALDMVVTDGKIRTDMKHFIADT